MNDSCSMKENMLQFLFTHSVCLILQTSFGEQLTRFEMLLRNYRCSLTIPSEQWSQNNSLEATSSSSHWTWMFKHQNTSSRICLWFLNLTSLIVKLIFLLEPIWDLMCILTCEMANRLFGSLENSILHTDT